MLGDGPSPFPVRGADEGEVRQCAVPGDGDGAAGDLLGGNVAVAEVALDPAEPRGVHAGGTDVEVHGSLSVKW